MADKPNAETKKNVKDLVRSAFERDGEDGLRELEDIFSSCLRETRERLAAGFQSARMDEGPVDREKYSEIIGESPGLMRVFRLIDRVADSVVPVLIQGESGTGKELVAAAIHHNSPRLDKPYVTENCAAIPETLLESELFGYKRGAFTGADRNKVGLFKVADSGTLFLDEIGDMSLGMQKKLLRVLQDGEIRPVGSNEIFHVDVRLLSASNKNLKKMVEQRRFREDLFYRLNTITITLPPLRDRPEDIPLLVEFFVERVAGEMGREPVPFSGEAMEALERYRWPGNIRELENEIRRGLALLGDADTFDLENLSENVRAAVGK